MPINTSSSDTGVTGAAKFVTSTVGVRFLVPTLSFSFPIPQFPQLLTLRFPLQNTVGGLARTVGGVAGAAGRGIGDTITGATGSAGKPLGDGLGNAASGVESGTKKVAEGVEDAGQWKSGAKRF